MSGGLGSLYGSFLPWGEEQFLWIGLDWIKVCFNLLSGVMHQIFGRPPLLIFLILGNYIDSHCFFLPKPRKQVERIHTPLRALECCVLCTKFIVQIPDLTRPKSFTL